MRTIYTLRWKGSDSLTSGGPFGFVEDFVPVSYEDALISCGISYRDLNVIGLAKWSMNDGAIDVEFNTALRDGEYLRLGNMHNGELVCSSGFKGPHQPFRDDSGYYYADDAPNARIYKDGKLLVDYWDGFVEIGKPWVHEGYLYFECNRLHERPDAWEIWKMNLSSGEKSKVSDGANPCVFDGKLYCGAWNGSRFDIATETLG